MRKKIQIVGIISVMLMSLEFGVRAEPTSSVESVADSVSTSQEIGMVLSRLKSALSEKSRFSRFQKVYSIVGQLSGEGVWAVINEFDTMSQYGEREDLRELLYMRWVESDPQAALSHLYQKSCASENVLLHKDLIEKTTEQWARTDLEAVSVYVEGQSFSEIPGLKEVLLTRIALVWAETDVLGSIGWFKEHCRGKLQGEGLNRIVSQVALADPARATALIDEVPNGYARHWTVSNIMSIWVKEDLSAALAWAESLPEGNKRRTALVLGIRHWLKDNSYEAADYILNTLSGDDFQKKVLREFAYEWAHNDPEAVLEWRENVQDESLRDTILSDIHIVWSDNAPEDAVKYAIGLPQPGSKYMILSRSGSVWGLKDKKAALRFSDSIEDFSSYLRFMEGVIEGIATHDPEGAADLFGELVSKGAGSPRMVESIIEYWSGYEPRAAGAWLLELAEVSHKNRGMEKLMEYWSGEEPTAAREWFQSNVLSLSPTVP
ncbi:hypothetical protein MLD52_03885 [Puniceicoccaceae bacterium K14]|nr:hypothetical protein [Puniceicoccaceae bacterium K14]